MIPQQIMGLIEEDMVCVCVGGGLDVISGQPAKNVCHSL